MNSRSLRILSAAALIVILIAIWIGYSRTPNSTENARLYPDLKGKLQSVTSVGIYKAGDQLAVELRRDGVQWKVKQRHDYPAEAGKVNTLLIKLEDATLQEPKTANAANYASLSVQDTSDPAATGVRIQLTGTASPVNLIVGKRDEATRSTYVRRAGEAQSWQAASELDVAGDPAQWLRRELLNIGADRIQDVSVQLAGSPAYSANKLARTEANFDVKGLPKGRELNSIAATNAVAQSLTSLQLEDVRPASEVASEKSSGRAVYKTFDGLVVECTGYRTGEHRWLTVKTSFDAEQAKRFYETPPAHPAEKTPAANPVTNATPPAGATLEALTTKGEQEANQLNAATATWAYSVPTYKFDAIFKPLEDLLKKPELLKKK